ncbi:transcriptional regulator [Rhodobacterales bacterium 56_14_T64]|nr:transcriptional regulator [Rhodobacterales bacterium 56_14_T64]
MERDHRSGCPIATTLDIVGDRWTLVILRDMLCGKSRFSDFMTSPEQITASVLTDRLARMEREGLVVKKTYQLRPKRYEYRLTDKGEALLPVTQAMSIWANRFMPDTWTPPESYMNRDIG